MIFAALSVDTAPRSQMTNHLGRSNRTSSRTGNMSRTK